MKSIGATFFDRKSTNTVVQICLYNSYTKHAIVFFHSLRYGHYIRSDHDGCIPADIDLVYGDITGVRDFPMMYDKITSTDSI